MSKRPGRHKARLAKRQKPYRRAPEAKWRRERVAAATSVANLPRCERCFKVCYPSEAAALTEMQHLGGRKAYPCPDDPSTWHLSNSG